MALYDIIRERRLDIVQPCDDPYGFVKDLVHMLRWRCSLRSVHPIRGRLWCLSTASPGLMCSLWGWSRWISRRAHADLGNFLSSFGGAKSQQGGCVDDDDEAPSAEASTLH
ncbi:hypothetical protein LIA77_11605 [Sarocladium implicatum]|nr:hypothetical protein LIA77_11605 [Sarocladium implicatum]